MSESNSPQGKPDRNDTFISGDRAEHAYILLQMAMVGQEGCGYKVLQRADHAGDSTEFVEFMLGMIRNALKEISVTHNITNVATNVVINVVTNEEKIIGILGQDGNMSANMLAASVGITERQVQRILAKLKDEGRIIRHGENKNGYWEVIE